MKFSARNVHRLRVSMQLAFAVALTCVIALTWKPLKAKYPWLPNWSADELLAFLAISFAVVQFIDARHQEHEISVIAKSMSTRFVGLFPKNLKDITEIASKATRYIYVIVDFVGYGQYSAPEIYAKYLQEMENALVRGVEVRFICYDDTLRNTERLVQFPDPPAKFDGEQNEALFRNYFEVHKGIRPLPSDNAGLRKVLNDREKLNAEQLAAKGLDLRVFAQRADFFLWLEDDEEAVFTFKNMGNRGKGFSFRTQDANLIGQFKDIFERRWLTFNQQQQPIATTPAVAAFATPGVSAPTTASPAAKALQQPVVVPVTQHPAGNGGKGGKPS